MSETFRWQALFQSTHDPIFILDRRKRLVFANRSWEALTGQSLADARGLTCTRRKTGAELSGLASTLAPPDDVFSGRSAHVRRAPPLARSGPPWWDIDFVPLMADGQCIGIFGRMIASPSTTVPASRRLTEAQAQLRAERISHFRLDGLEERFPSLAQAAAQARLAAQADTPALLLGEPGTGRRWLARAIHAHGDRRDRPFVTLDAGALPAAAVAGVLFGPLGVYRADGAGTIHIREPAALPLDAQDELAQQLKDGGRDRPRILASVDSPLVAGELTLETCRLLPALYDALSVVIIRLPPLRERAAEINIWAEWFLHRSSGRRELTDAARECLAAYSWPGNLNEMELALRDAAERAGGKAIDAGDLPLAIRQARAATEVPPPTPASLPALDAALHEVEKRLILLALKRANGNQTRAAEMLAIWRPRLVRRMKALGIDEP